MADKIIFSMATDVAVIHKPVDSRADRVADHSAIFPVVGEQSLSTVDVGHAAGIGMI